MKIKALKTGKYSLHPAFGPIVDFEAGQILDRDFTEDHATEIEKDGWGVRMTESKTDKTKKQKKGIIETVKTEPSSATQFYNDLIKGVVTIAEQKSILQSYGVEYLKIKVSKAKTVNQMIKELAKVK